MLGTKLLSATSAAKLKVVDTAAVAYLGSTYDGITIAGAVQGDLVLAFYGVGKIDASRSFLSAGYTTSSWITRTDTYSSQFMYGYKIMGSTPDTVVETSGSGDSAVGAALGYVLLRGVDQTTPLDVAAVSATGANSVRANPSSILPVTNDAIIVAAGFGAWQSAGSGSKYFTSSDLAGFDSDSVTETGNGCTIGVGHKEWLGGTFDPAQFGFDGTDSTLYSWTAFTLAIRPA
jgi:hypothetical protein